MKNKKILTGFITFIILSFAIQFSVCAKEMSIDDFEEKTIGVQTGTVYADTVTDVFKNPNVRYFTATTDGCTALKMKKIDAFFADSPVVRYLASNTKNIKYMECGSEIDYMSIISAKTEEGERRVAEFNEFFRKLKESGKYDKLIQKWFDGKESNRVMTDYSQLPNINGVVKVGMEISFPPFEYVKNNAIVGFEPELMYLFCKEKGYKLEISDVDFGGIIAGVVSGKYDYGASGFSITEERKQEVLFTDVIYESSAAIAYYGKDVNEKGFIQSIINGFNKTFIDEDRWKMFASGLLKTVEITVFSIIFGLILGFLIYLLRRKENKIINKSYDFINWLISGMPIVVFLMVLFYIIFGAAKISETVVAIIGFTIIFTLHTVGILTVGENAIDKGQETAARALGYTKTGAFFKIILPQEFIHIIPLFKSEIVSHIKETAIVGYIAVVDITKVGDIIRGRTYDAFFPLISVAVMYFVIATLLKAVVNVVYKKVKPESRTEEQIMRNIKQ